MDPVAAAMQQHQAQQMQQLQQQQWMAQVAAQQQQQQQLHQQQQMAMQQQLAFQQQQLAQQQQQAALASGGGQPSAAEEAAEEEEEEEEVVGDPNDSDYTAQEEDEEEEEEGSRGRRRRRGGDEGEEDSESESDPDYQDGRGSGRKRRRGATPPGARRSSRIKHRVIDVASELAVEEPEPLDSAPRRGLRSTGPANLPEGASAPVSVAPSALLLGSRAGSEQPAPKPVKAGPVSTLPNPKDIRREHTEEQMREDLSFVKNMWEMAATLDYLTLFKKQLNVSRSFSAAELEHVMAYSDGRDGLLADLHIDIMRGISPKQEVPRDAWQVHLANKIKYHWRPLLNGLHCPFKPDKYFEAYQYARLGAEDRVRALHFLCTIRCDREDIQFRVAESCSREWNHGEIQLLMMAQQDAVRRGKPDEAPTVDLGSEAFRRQPNGLDRHGGRYYIIDFLRASDFRMYREVPASHPHAPPAGSGEGGAGTAPDSPAVAMEAAAGEGASGAHDLLVKQEPAAAQAGQEAAAQPEEPQLPQPQQAAAATADPTDVPSAPPALKQETAAPPVPKQEAAAGPVPHVAAAPAAARPPQLPAAPAQPVPAPMPAPMPAPAPAPAPFLQMQPGGMPPGFMHPSMAALAQQGMGGLPAAMAAMASQGGLPAVMAALARPGAVMPPALAAMLGPAAAQMMAAQAAAMQAAMVNAQRGMAAAAAAAQLQQEQEWEEEGESWVEQRQRLLEYQVPADPQPELRWELVASSLEEFEEHATRFSSSGNTDEATFAMRLRQFVIPTIVALKEEEERRTKATERVQKKLGVQASVAAALSVLPPEVASALAPAGGGPSGSGGSGVAAGGRGGSSAAAVDAGRTRRTRARVNYAFNDYDETLRSAIRSTQRGEEESEDELGGRRRRRRAPSPSNDPSEAARGGLRRGRSVKEEGVAGVSQFVDERQLRAAVAYGRGSRAGSRAASGTDLARMYEQEGEEEGEGEEADERRQVAEDESAGVQHGEQHNGNIGNNHGSAEVEADASAYVTATMLAPRGRGRGGRGGGGGARKSANKVKYLEDEEGESESEPDAGAAEDVSEDEYVPTSRRR